MLQVYSSIFDVLLFRIWLVDQTVANTSPTWPMPVGLCWWTFIHCSGTIVFVGEWQNSCRCGSVLLTYINLPIIQSVDYASQKKKFYITITFICFEKPTWVMWQTWVTIVHCSLHGQQNFANLWIHTTTDDVAVINGVTFDLAHIFTETCRPLGGWLKKLKFAGSCLFATVYESREFLFRYSHFWDIVDGLCAVQHVWNQLCFVEPPVNPL